MKVYTQGALAMAFIAMLCCVAQAQDYYASAYNSADAYVAQAQQLESGMATLRGNLGGDCACATCGCDPCACSSCGCDPCGNGCCGNGCCGDGCCANGCCDAGCCGGCCDPCCYDSCCNNCCEQPCYCPAIQFWVDATLFRFHKTGGVNVGNSDQGVANEENAELGYFLSPRFNLRYYGSNGMYYQLSYFEFNHGTILSANDPGSSIGVRSWTLDAVAGERFMLNKYWTLDWNGGARLYDYSETAVDRDEVANGNTEFNFDHSWGIGGIVGLDVSRCLGNGLSVYGGARFGVVHGDHTQIYNRNGAAPVNRRMLDENFIQTEISTGFEYSSFMANGTEVISKLGWEWITYENASSQFTAPTLAEAARTAGADVGYGGVTFSLGFYR